MKVLVVTGVLAENIVRDYAKQSKTETQVLPLKVPVAAFLTPQTILEALKKEKTEGFDMILVPGLIRGDTTTISKSVNIPTFKGPRYAADLPTVLDSIGEVTLSTTVPACDLLKEKLKEKALQELSKVEQNRDLLLKNPSSMLIKNLAIGKDFPMRIMAEIVDAALIESSEIQRLAQHYVELGADIIDLGMIAGENRPADAKRIVEAVKEVVDVPVSIDTLNPEEIKEAIVAGADLILSADAGNIEKIAPFIQDAAVVVIPTNQCEGYFPKNATERVRMLEQVIEKARQLGVKRILGDLILEPSNILKSFIAFQEFANRNPNVPLFVGVSNVTELIDADSVGVNAILARLSSEVNASVMLATEKSDKAKGTVNEEVTAAKMMFLAKKRGSIPKDLGIDLLILKNKRSREEPYDRDTEAYTQVYTATEKNEQPKLDKEGSFRIALDRIEETIVATHFLSSKMDTPTKIIKGKNAESVHQKILEMGLISKLDHAGYLGRELTKAEIALVTGKEYIQDVPIFKK